MINNEPLSQKVPSLLIKLDHIFNEMFQFLIKMTNYMLLFNRLFFFKLASAKLKVQILRTNSILFQDFFLLSNRNV
jgi:hypothetical protein